MKTKMRWLLLAIGVVAVLSVLIGVSAFRLSANVDPDQHGLAPFLRNGDIEVIFDCDVVERSDDWSFYHTKREGVWNLIGESMVLYLSPARIVSVDYEYLTADLKNHLRKISSLRRVTIYVNVDVDHEISADDIMYLKEQMGGIEVVINVIP